MTSEEYAWQRVDKMREEIERLSGLCAESNRLLANTIDILSNLHDGRVTAEEILFLFAEADALTARLLTKRVSAG